MRVRPNSIFRGSHSPRSAERKIIHLQRNFKPPKRAKSNARSSVFQSTCQGWSAAPQREVFASFRSLHLHRHAAQPGSCEHTCGRSRELERRVQLWQAQLLEHLWEGTKRSARIVLLQTLQSLSTPLSLLFTFDTFLRCIKHRHSPHIICTARHTRSHPLDNADGNMQRFAVLLLMAFSVLSLATQWGDERTDYVGLSYQLQIIVKADNLAYSSKTSATLTGSASPPQSAATAASFVHSISHKMETEC